MNYLDEMYIIDTVVAATLTVDIIESSFFDKYCFVPEEIRYELRNNPLHPKLQNNEIKTDINILSQLKNVFSAMDNNSRLVDLYQNMGNGDALIIATVLAKRAEELGKLFPDKWTIVTEDKGLCEVARKHDIEYISRDDFLEIVRRNMNGDL